MAREDACDSVTDEYLHYELAVRKVVPLAAHRHRHVKTKRNAPDDPLSEGLKSSAFYDTRILNPAQMFSALRICFLRKHQPTRASKR